MLGNLLIMLGQIVFGHFANNGWAMIGQSVTSNTGWANQCLGKLLTMVGQNNGWAMTQ